PRARETRESEMEGEAMMSIRLTSDGFTHGGEVPRRYTCDGEDLSPPLSWEGVPEGAVSLALIADDPDAPAGTWVHWVLYGLDAATRALPEAVPTDENVLDGAKQGHNDFRRIGYGGPCPPPNGAHRYFFTIYALSDKMHLDAGATKAELLRAMEGKVLAQGQLMGTYRRP
ncbi:MAG: YbhB/YbcL family Raf kinase inhibitor-like protein, partial [Gemmatimonadales bacterium]